ncbi:LytTR family DNA-binding domain-containing protein [Maricaulis parjimensis]|uniref:LytTR family DNA-binding domain-containing protein n=1 Tax=Maricaulis parjimensis TaxID=144023 RepID=UPI00193ABFFC|nr:LytTR family DNA-binding domain-containing protein [Maricaulis parjimensis]
MIDRLKSLAPKIAAILAVGTFLTVLAPYNTSALGLPWLWIYWTGLIAFGFGCGEICTWTLERTVPDWPRFARGLAASFMVSIPVTAAVALIQFVMGGAFPLYVLPMIYFFVWVISAAVTVVTLLVEQRQDLEVAGDAQPGALPALTEKMPHKLRHAAILALSAEDHYLRVHTESGDCLILMRLSDAITAVDALDGARTHRSWWVAKDAVERVSRGDGRATLSLKNGIEAPVSRTYAPKLREAGWY